MIRVYRYLLLDLDVVNALEDRQPMADTDNGHLFQLLVSQCYQCFPDYLVFYIYENSLA